MTNILTFFVIPNSFEDGSWETGVRSQKSEDRSRETGDRS